MSKVERTLTEEEEEWFRWVPPRHDFLQEYPLELEEAFVVPPNREKELRRLVATGPNGVIDYAGLFPPMVINANCFERMNSRISFAPGKINWLFWNPSWDEIVCHLGRCLLLAIWK